jgi:hypothetical protein
MAVVRPWDSLYITEASKLRIGTIPYNIYVPYAEKLSYDALGDSSHYFTGLKTLGSTLHWFWRVGAERVK